MHKLDQLIVRFRVVRAILAGLILAVGANASASTVTMDFEAYAPNGGIITSYQGFQWSGPWGGVNIAPEFAGNNADDADGAVILAENATPAIPITIAPEPGAGFTTFDLVSLNFGGAFAFGTDYAGLVDLKGYDAGGTEVASFNFAGQSSETRYLFYPNTFGAEWHGLSRIEFTARDATPYINVDDIVVTVPEPSVVGLLGVGVILAGRRRRPV